MKENPRPLLAVQNIDLEIVAHEEALAANLAAAQQFKARSEHASQDVRKAEQEHAGLKLELQHCEQSLKASEEAKSKLLKQSATIKKNDEYQAAMAQIADLEKAIAQGEEQVLAAMDKLEAHQSQVEKTRQTAAQVQTAAAGELRKCQAEHTRLSAAIKDLQSRRAAAAAEVAPALLRRYELLRASKIYSRKQPALVMVDDGTCARCHRRIPTQHCNETRHGELETCENCGALLYSEAFLNEQDIHI